MVLPQGHQIGKAVDSGKPQIEDQQIHRQPGFKHGPRRVGISGFMHGDVSIQLAKRLYQPFPDQSVVFDN